MLDELDNLNCFSKQRRNLQCVQKSPSAVFRGSATPPLYTLQWITASCQNLKGKFGIHLLQSVLFI